MSHVRSNGGSWRELPLRKTRILLLDNYVNRKYLPSIPRRSRDVSRSSRCVGAGCDGRCGVSAVQAAPTKTLAAYGEIVWSWRRDPGATCGSLLPHNGGKKGRSPGRARISRKTIARGKPGCLGCTCQTRVHSLLLQHTVACGRSRRPAFPAPSVRERDDEMKNLGQIVLRE